MIAVLVALLGIAGLVFLGEYLQRARHYHPEVTRKFIHISVATFAALWPFFMSWSHIELISLLLFFGVAISRYFHLFQAIHSIKRHTWGELFFAMSIGIVAVLSQDKWIFSAAMLHLGLADGLAALVGTLIGQHRYKVLGHSKTYEGSITFFLLSFVIVWVCAVANGPQLGWTVLLWVPLVATFFENFAVAGTDNLLVPFVITILL